MNINAYLKAIAAISGAVTTTIVTLYPGAHWLPIVTVFATALSVYLTPNISKTSVPVPLLPPMSPSATALVDKITADEKSNDGWDKIQ